MSGILFYTFPPVGPITYNHTLLSPNDRAFADIVIPSEVSSRCSRPWPRSTVSPLGSGRASRGQSRHRPRVVFFVEQITVYPHTCAHPFTQARSISPADILFPPSSLASLLFFYCGTLFHSKNNHTLSAGSPSDERKTIHCVLFLE